MDILQFMPGEQNRFLQEALSVSGLSAEELARKLGVSKRSVIDWKKENLRLSLTAAEYICTQFHILLPESKKILINRWRDAQQQANRIGGMTRYRMYGSFATPEGRRKGGKNTQMGRKRNAIIWHKYASVIAYPQESEDFAEFIGIMLGDGGLTSYQCTIYLHSDTDKEFAYYVRDLITRLFHITPTITKRRREKVLRVSIASVDLIRYLVHKGLVKGNKVQLQVGAPTWIWSKPEYIRACICGLVDTDGCFVLHTYKVRGKEYVYPKLSFCNRSEPLLAFVLYGLQRLGYTSKRTSIKNVWLHNKDEVRTYLQEIGTRNYKPAVKLIMEGC